MTRHMSKEGQKERLERIMELRDEQNLEFKVIGQRLGMQVPHISKLYNDEKARRRNA